MGEVDASGSEVLCACGGDVPHPHDPEWECPAKRVVPNAVAERRGTWDDPAIVDDSRVEHMDPIVRKIAESLHRNESMHLHQYVASQVCPYCALRASRAARVYRQASATSTNGTPS